MAQTVGADLSSPASRVSKRLVAWMGKALALHLAWLEDLTDSDARQIYWVLEGVGTGT